MYKRILIKLSGEWLANKKKGLLIDYKLVKKIANQIKIIRDKGYEIGIVVGGGNLWRGASAEKNGIPRNRADYIGMLGTMMNALALQSVFEKNGIKTRVNSALNIDGRVAQYYIKDKADIFLKNSEVIIFAAGTGRPYFTTDTAATLLASEIQADVLLLGKNNTLGVYDSDPNINPEARFYNKITYDEILQKNLKVMDLTATSMAKDNNLTILVFDISKENAIINALEKKGEFTEVGC